MEVSIFLLRSRTSYRSGEGETYSRIGLLRSYGNLQSYMTTTELWKLTVVLDYYEAMETYSRIGLLRSYGTLQSYFTSGFKRFSLKISESVEILKIKLCKEPLVIELVAVGGEKTDECILGRF